MRDDKCGLRRRRVVVSGGIRELSSARFGANSLRALPMDELKESLEIFFLCFDLRQLQGEDACAFSKGRRHTDDLRMPRESPR